MLIVPTGSQAFASTQLSATARPANNSQTAVTPTIGSKGSWASIVSSTANDSFGILINVSGNSASALTRETVLDIGIDPAGGTSYQVLIPDLLCGSAVNYTTAPHGVWYFFPIFIPAGSQIAGRGQSTVTNLFRVSVQLSQKPFNPAMVRTGTYVEALGLGTLPSGTGITEGTTTEGSWTLMGTTTKRLWWWQVGFQPEANDIATGNAVVHLDIAAGNGTDFDIIAQDLIVTTNTAEAVGSMPKVASCEYDVPSGTNIYVRGQNSAAPNVALQCSVYGMGG